MKSWGFFVCLRDDNALKKQLQAIIFPTMLASLLTACTGERPIDLGVKNGVLTPCPESPNCVSSLADDKTHRIEPLQYRDDPYAAFARLASLLKGRKDTMIIEETGSYLRAELRTTLFVDDAEFLLDRERRVIQLRSASRLGYSDLGKNRRRLEEIRKDFEKTGPES